MNLKEYLYALYDELVEGYGYTFEEILSLLCEKDSKNNYTINYKKISIPEDFVEPEMQYSLFVESYNFHDYPDKGFIENISIFDFGDESDNLLYLDFDCCNFNNVNLENVFADIKIYVPKDSLEAYKTATNWAEYATMIYAE